MRYALRVSVVLLAGVLLAPVASAQTPLTSAGRITGRVINAVTGLPILRAEVMLGGTMQRSLTDLDGRFFLQNVTPGAHTVDVRQIGFTAKTVTNVVVRAGETTVLDVSLSSAVIAVEAITVTAEVERGTVSRALQEQRTAPNVVSTIGSEQIAKSPDGDAAQAVKRVSGVTVEDGKYVFVRGLGGRYTTTSLNGSRVPSPEPETRVVPLDLFPAGLLQSITTSKSFTPDRQGDFAGAVVDIKTQEFPADRAATLELGGGYAARATGADLLSATGVGGEGLAWVNRGRDLPPELRALGNFQGVNLTQQDQNHLVGLFRDSWSPQPSTGMPPLNGSASLGGNDAVFGQRIGYLFSGTTSTGTEVKSDARRAVAYPGTTRGETVEYNPFSGNSADRSVLWGGMANLSTLIGGSSRLSFNGLYNRSADNSAQVEDGLFSYTATPVQLTRMQYVQRSVYSVQLLGEHGLGRHHLDWRVAANSVRRFEPDRSEFTQVIGPDTTDGQPVLRWLTAGSEGAVRTFSDLNEHAREFAANYRLDLGGGAAPASLKVGGLYRHTSRDAESFSYVISAHNYTDDILELPPEQIFDGRFATDTSALFTVAPLSQGGSYTARDRLGAGYLMAEVPVGRTIRIVGGARYESDHLDMHATSTLGTPVNPTKVWNDWLPSLALNVQLTQNQQLRLSVARTLARPEYREITPIISRDVVGGENVQGDSAITRTNVTGVDARWEIYPSPGEIFGVSLFGKHFTRPIERVYGSSSGETGYVFFTNAEGADVYGVEIEVRKNLSFLADALTSLTVFLNSTIMRSRIHLFADTRASATNASRAMVGQAPYVINAGLTYGALSGTWSGTLLYNRTGPRITEAGTIPVPDASEQPRNVLDFSLRVSLGQSILVRVDAKNLLDAPYHVLQGSVTRQYYRTGRTLQAGIGVRL